MSLRDEILAGGFDLVNRDDGNIAATLSAGRTVTVATEIGVGTILETIGVAAGNSLLDYLMSAVDFRHIRPLLEQGRLRIDSPLVIAILDSFVPALLTAEQAAALVGLGKRKQTITAQEVAAALEGM